jgi:2-polyprenyl-3-methyl-5-hydroxy-6-metoxy-1,4-benzoquinol methylase
MHEDFQILNTWNLNARAWINTIANNRIETRRLVTNRAIEETIVSLHPKKMLDLGCGEGWLIRALQEKLPDTDFYGIDAIAELIDAAKKLHPGASFLTHSYESIIDGGFKPAHTFDVIAINFALFGKDIVGDLMKTIRLFISSGGHLVIQTLHPHTSNAVEPYTDGWRQGNWNGFSDDFKSPAPWYFRTFESWINLFTESGYSIKKIQEPIHPVSLQPASVIFTLSV